MKKYCKKMGIGLVLALLSMFSISLIAPAMAEDKVIKMSTTTSTENSGLLDVVLPELNLKELPETEFEKDGLIDREKLFSIKGRRRLTQMRLAKTWDIKDYPCPAGGCLLTDPQFALRLRFSEI